MAELRTCEQGISELQSIYESLRKCAGNDKIANELPALTTVIAATTDASTSNSSSSNENDITAAAVAVAATAPLSSTELLEKLERIRTKLVAFTPKMDKFGKRLTEKDPVTDKPRYGDKTIKRVQQLLQAYEELNNGIAIAFGEETVVNNGSDGTVSSANNNTARTTPVIEEIRSKAKEEEAQAAEAARLKALQEEEERQRQEMAVRQREEQERQAAEAARLEALQREAELDRLAQEERQAQRRAQQAADRADAEWMNSITKGPDGVREQLQRLQQATENDLVARSIAMDALHQLFSQIVAHPEETKFRRVRRDHERFNADIGRHEGGKEVLIAAGFVLGAIDDVPSYISKEPNIEKDMEGWASWFDLLKATLQIIEEELVK